MATTGATSPKVSGTPPVKVVTAEQTGFNALTSQDFMKLLVTQLQNQDPTQPVGNAELLTQISQMRGLQSNVELGDAVKSVSTNQNLSTAASFIGKTITGTDADGKDVSGTVDRAYTSSGDTFVRVGDASIKLGDIKDVTQ